MLRRVLLAAQVIGLLVFLTISILAVSQPSYYRPMLMMGVLPPMIRAGALVLLSLRLRWGWIVLVISTLIGFSQPWGVPATLPTILLSVLRSGLACGVPVAGFLLWTLLDERRERREFAVPLITAVAVLVAASSVALDLSNITRTFMTEPTRSLMLMGTVWQALSSLGLILIGLRRIEGWCILFASVSIHVLAQAPGIFGGPGVLLGALNLAQWHLGTRLARSAKGPELQSMIY
ncbi:hypothetical protein EON81_26740 [bacterium]|nr:MAG: hypothetical protein EON81_26740 [bacterium]